TDRHCARSGGHGAVAAIVEPSAWK
ncbi:hypothetical protein XPU_0283, partial [Xanthomonas arboricola pv. pruni str. MAFF 311562]